MNDGLMDFINNIDAMIKDIESGAFKKACVIEIKAFLEPKIKQCVADAVDTWRETYTPKYYDPTGGLKDMYEMKITEKAFNISYGSEYGSGSYRSPSSVYKIVFKEGYHGGYWRVPLNVWKYRSPRKTVQGPSIFDLAEKNIDSIWESEVEPEIDNIVRKKILDYGVF